MKASRKGHLGVVNALLAAGGMRSKDYPVPGVENIKRFSYCQDVLLRHVQHFQGNFCEIKQK